MNVPPGHRMLCPTCSGEGRVVRERAVLASVGRLAHGAAGERCRPCEGTGWIPPKHEPKPGTEPNTDNA